MNDLSLFNSNQSKEFVTTKQLAEILGVDVRTVQRAVEKTGYDSTVAPLKN